MDFRQKKSEGSLDLYHKQEHAQPDSPDFHSTSDLSGEESDFSESGLSYKSPMRRKEMLRKMNDEILDLNKVKKETKKELRYLAKELKEQQKAKMSGSDYLRRRDELANMLSKEENDLKEIKEERDQAMKDKANVESAYTDVQEKYERVLKTLISLKDKEQRLLQRDSENLIKIEKKDRELDLFKESACKQIEREYQKWMSKLEEAEATNLRLKAMIRKSDMKVEKLEYDLGQKTKENDQLHNLCDDLIQNSSRKNSLQD